LASSPSLSSSLWPEWLHLFDPQVTDGSTSTKAAKMVARKQMLSNLMKRAVLGGLVAN
jgi:hypothetical protein